jgi:hypothetical protein
MEAFEDRVRRGGATAMAEVDRFFGKEGPVHQSLRRITTRLEELSIPYAVAGGMALIAHGYERTTVDVHMLVTSDGPARLHRALDGLGYVPPFKGSKNLRDVETGVRIKFLVTGQFPGDGKPKPVSFPDPRQASIEIDGIRYLGLPALIELKLASGMTSPLRLKDLADVQELIRALNLPAETAGRIDPSVRDKYLEFWNALRAAPREE